VIVATLVALRVFDGLRGQRIHLTFADTRRGAATATKSMELPRHGSVWGA
jgi:hypothetical protein